MKIKKWRAYDELAWVEPIIAPPEEYQEESRLYCDAIIENSSIEVSTLLHLGCGAGINDYTFKEYFRITGVDISPEMLKVALKINPQVSYLQGDMRKIMLGRQFDSVVIPDSISYQLKWRDLCKTIVSAYKHLRIGGVLLITASLAEQFKENNFVYTGSRGEVEVTLFENNYITCPHRTSYEATFIYLIRQSGEQEIYTDVHQASLFKMGTWEELFRRFNLNLIDTLQLDHLYAPYIMGEGEFPLVTFVCRKES